MKIAYFDCFSGISGDMILGALLDTGLSIEFFRHISSQLKMDSVEITGREVLRAGVRGMKADILIKGDDSAMSYSDIVSIISESGLEDELKESSIRVFDRLAAAEEVVHGIKKEELHFHDMVGMDLIVDITCSLAGLKEVGVEEVYSSTVNLGYGFVSSSGHGRIPVPGPAVSELMKGYDVYSAYVRKELTTPTGAGLITSLVEVFQPLPPMIIDKVGYGAGENDNSELPNLLRLFIGYKPGKLKEGGDTVLLLETNIDDMNPQVYEFLFDRLFSAGALDVFLVPIIMKKGRPAFILSVIVDPERKGEVEDIIFSETTTIGIREQPVARRKLCREELEIETSFGLIKCKIISDAAGEVRRVVPEYDEVKRIALKRGIPLFRLMHELQVELEEKKPGG